MNAPRVPRVGERWVFKVWAHHDLNYRGAVRILGVDDGPAHLARVICRFEASGNELITDLTAFLDQYQLDDTEPDQAPVDMVGPTAPRPTLQAVR